MILIWPYIWPYYDALVRLNYGTFAQNMFMTSYFIVPIIIEHKAACMTNMQKLSHGAKIYFFKKNTQVNKLAFGVVHQLPWIGIQGIFSCGFRFLLCMHGFVLQQYRVTRSRTSYRYSSTGTSTREVLAWHAAATCHCGQLALVVWKCVYFGHLR